MPLIGQNPPLSPLVETLQNSSPLLTSPTEAQAKQPGREVHEDLRRLRYAEPRSQDAARGGAWSAELGQYVLLQRHPPGAGVSPQRPRVPRGDRTARARQQPPHRVHGRAAGLSGSAGAQRGARAVRRRGPRTLNAELTSKLRAFRGNKQQDSQELLQFLFKLVGNEQRRCSVQDRGLVDLYADTRESDGIAESVRSISELRLSQAVDERNWNPFHGLQVNLLQCTRCQRFRPLNNQPFLDVSLSLVAPGDRKVAKLTDALQLYTEPEVIKGVECSYCSVVAELDVTRKEYAEVMKMQGRLEQGIAHASASEILDLEITQHERRDWIHTLEQLTNSTANFDLEHLERSIPRSRGDCHKRLQFSRSPDVFCFHLNRKVYRRTGGAVKLETYVEFPLELDMSTYCQYELDSVAEQKVSNGTTRTANALKRRSGFSPPPFSEATKQQYLLYDLTAVILHHGNERCGHFTAYRRANPSQWFFVSDESVREAPIAEVLSSCAYMLFYERKFRTKRTARSSETEETTDDDDSLPDVPFEPSVLLSGRF